MFGNKCIVFIFYEFIFKIKYKIFLYKRSDNNKSQGFEYMMEVKSMLKGLYKLISMAKVVNNASSVILCIVKTLLLIL